MSFVFCGPLCFLEGSSLTVILHGHLRTHEMGVEEPVLSEGCTASEAHFLLVQIWRPKAWFKVLTIKGLLNVGLFFFGNIIP